MFVIQVGLFSLGIIPYINASIVLQLMSAAFPALKKMQREDGPQGRARFQYYQKLAAFVFAIAQVCAAQIAWYLQEWQGGAVLQGSLINNTAVLVEACVELNCRPYQPPMWLCQCIIWRLYTIWLTWQDHAVHNSIIHTCMHCPKPTCLLHCACVLSGHWSVDVHQAICD